MPLVEQELLALTGNLRSPPVFNGVRVTWSLVLCVCFVDRCLSFSIFCFGHCVVCFLDIRILTLLCLIWGFLCSVLWTIVWFLVFSLLRFTTFDYAFGIFKHYFSNKTDICVAIINVVAENGWSQRNRRFSIFCFFLPFLYLLFYQLLFCRHVLWIRCIEQTIFACKGIRFTTSD